MTTLDSATDNTIDFNAAAAAALLRTGVQVHLARRDGWSARRAWQRWREHCGDNAETIWLPAVWFAFARVPLAEREFAVAAAAAAMPFAALARVLAPEAHRVRAHNDAPPPARAPSDVEAKTVLNAAIDAAREAGDDEREASLIALLLERQPDNAALRARLEVLYDDAGATNYFFFPLAATGTM